MSSQSFSQSVLPQSISELCESASDIEDDKKRSAIADSVYLNRALELYNDFHGNAYRIDSHLPPYYISFQRSYIRHFADTLPNDEQRSAVAQLFVQSYVIGAEGERIKSDEWKTQFSQIREEICQSIAQNPNIDVVRSYTGDNTLSENRLRINTHVMIDHHLAWMSLLAQNDGAAYRARLEQSSKQPSP
jgi:hypothetical protein